MELSDIINSYKRQLPIHVQGQRFISLFIVIDPFAEVLEGYLRITTLIVGASYFGFLKRGFNSECGNSSTWAYATHMVHSVIQLDNTNQCYVRSSRTILRQSFIRVEIRVWLRD